MKLLTRRKLGSAVVETAFAMPVLLCFLFSFFEVARAMYIYSALGIAAQKVATEIAVNAQRSNTYSLSGFTTFADQVRLPGAVLNSNQFSFDVTNPTNTSTVMSGLADGATSTKVVVTASFPPPGDNSVRIPLFDPGNFFGTPIFGINGLPLSSSATCFLERSRRPTLN